jgi:Zn-dependent M28 family amino/carboxypeptidase
MPRLRTLFIVGLLALPIVLVVLYGRYLLVVPGHSYDGPLAAPTTQERALAERLKAHVATIAKAPHNIQYPEALEAAARYIERELERMGYAINRQEFTVNGVKVRNIEAVLEPATPGPTLVLGAHYESYGHAPGANDNASGTAAVIELARMFKARPPERTRLRFVLFVNEEPPYYRTPDMGSWRYAQRLSQSSEKVLGMISLETIGVFSDAPNSQRYPQPFGLLFPSTANFVAFVGLTEARSFLHEVIASFRRHAAFSSIGAVGPDIVAGIGWSDHWAFHQFGIPAIMVTDTALFRYPHYHRPTDTPDKLDYDKLARIVQGLEPVVRDIAR